MTDQKKVGTGSDWLDGALSDRPISRMEFVLQHVTNAIAAGKLRPGDKLPNEKELADTLGVSRTPVREALKTLAIAGLVDIRHGYGTYLRESRAAPALNLGLFQLHLQDSSPRKLMELRTLIERSCAELAAERRDDNDLATMRSSIDRLKHLSSDPASSLDDLLAADMDFHRAIYAATKNELIQTVAQFVLEMIAPWIRKSLDVSGRRKAARLHDMLLEAIERQDVEGVTRYHSVEANMTHFRTSLEEAT